MRLVVDRQLTPGAAVKVETGDALLLGEVCYSVAGSAGFEAGIELQHSLVGLTELARLNSRLVNGWEAPVSAQGQDPKDSLKDEVAARRR